ncbi:hypothetical protein [Salinimonas lutimaris]|nr:hypothetical protein [Salinimonas lutimaris]
MLRISVDLHELLLFVVACLAPAIKPASGLGAGYYVHTLAA